ncbi:MAG: hypothetical protein ACI8W8_005126 [Rhodothermales bacterium]|jgi:hypothetical protein
MPPKVGSKPHFTRLLSEPALRPSEHQQLKGVNCRRLGFPTLPSNKGPEPLDLVQFEAAAASPEIVATSPQQPALGRKFWVNAAIRGIKYDQVAILLGCAGCEYPPHTGAVAAKVRKEPVCA